MDLTRDRGRRAWLEEVEMLERRRTRRPWQAIRPGVRSSKLDVFIILLPLLHKFLKSTVLYILLHFLLHRACQVVRLKWALQKLVNALKKNSTSFKINITRKLDTSIELL